MWTARELLFRVIGIKYAKNNQGKAKSLVEFGHSINGKKSIKKPPYKEVTSNIKMVLWQLYLSNHIE